MSSQPPPQVQLQQHLDAGEVLLWSGQPATGVRLRPTDAFLIPFSLLWGGFAVFWEASVLVSNAPFFFRLWGIPFVLVGLYITVGRFFVDARVRSRTAYGLTNQRILIVSGLFARTITSRSLRSLTEVTVKELADGSGTITFGATPGASFGITPRRRDGRPVSPAFEFIPEVRRVNTLLREAQLKA